GNASKGDDFWTALADARKEYRVVEHEAHLFYSRAVKNVERLPERERTKEYEYFLLCRDSELPERGTGAPRALTGEYLASVGSRNDKLHGPVVEFAFNGRGAQLLTDLTTKNKGRQMAIVLDDLIQVAAKINEPLTGGSGII